MNIVKIINDGIVTEIHGEKVKLKSGSVVKGINCIDSFTFSMYVNNPGFDKCCDYKTLVEVYNTNKRKYEFRGRVLCSKTSMTESGLITRDITCESYFGFLCDSIQTYVEEKNWTVKELFNHIIDCHNSQVETYKQFKIGEISAVDPLSNIYIGIQRENTWSTIGSKLVNNIGGEIRYRTIGDVIYIDYVAQLGVEKTTPIKLSSNMKAITKDVDPSAFVTRLIPLGAKLKKTVTSVDSSGNTTTTEVETEERTDITSVNGGKNYIDDEDAISTYGIHVGVLELDDVTLPENLLRKGREWLESNNKIAVKYSITALDLSLLGLVYDDFEICNYYPIENDLLNIHDTARIIKQTINVCDEHSSSFEVGDNFQRLSEVQRQNIESIKEAVTSIKSDADKNLKLHVAEVNRFTQLMVQSLGVYKTEKKLNDGSTVYYLHNDETLEGSETIWKMTADGVGVSTDGGKTYHGMDSTGNIVAAMVSAVRIQAHQIDVDNLSAISANLAGWNIDKKAIYKDVVNPNNANIVHRIYLQPPSISNPENTWVLSCQKSTDGGSSFQGTFILFADGSAKFGSTMLNTDGSAKFGANTILYADGSAKFGTTIINTDGSAKFGANTVLNADGSVKFGANTIVYADGSAKFGDFEISSEGEINYKGINIESDGYIWCRSDITTPTNAATWLRHDGLNVISEKNAPLSQGGKTIGYIRRKEDDKCYMKTNDLVFDTVDGETPLTDTLSLTDKNGNILPLRFENGLLMRVEEE